MFNSQVNLFFSVRYVIDTRTIVSPYFGGKFGASFLIPSDDETDVDTSTAIFVAVPMGVLLALNKSVAISLGLEVQVYAWLDGPYMKDTVQLQVPVGYIGVEAFF
ncbi:MAG TPA: hypothetical protein P5076_14250, partial [Myxococcota bacterium]|nr:hypothetical protein [Myxococcota bacterium]